MIETRVLSLVRATERRDRIKRRLDFLGIPFTFFDAIDGQKMTESEVARFDPRPMAVEFGKPMSRGEIGCAASYYRMFHEIAAGDHPFVFVCEDDVEFEPDILPLLEQQNLDRLPEFDVLRLSLSSEHLKGYVLPISRIAGRMICAPVAPGNNMHAFIINRKSAKKLADQLIPLLAPVDNMLFRDVYFRGRRIYQVLPPVADADGKDTTIPRSSLAIYGIKKTPVRIARRMIFVMRRKIRSLVRFIDTWGLTALFRLQRAKNFAVKQA